MNYPACDPTSPGFKYNVDCNFLSTRKTLPTFSLGARRNVNGDSGLVNVVSTPINVGPDKYTPQYNTVSRIKCMPKIRVGSEMRFRGGSQNLKLHETYYVYSSIGGQIDSRKLTENKYSMQRADRMRNTQQFGSAKILKMSLPHAAY